MNETAYTLPELTRMARAGDLVTTQTAARHLGVSERCIRKWVDTEKVKPLGKTKPYLFVLDDLIDYARTTNSAENRRAARAAHRWRELRGTVPAEVDELCPQQSPGDGCNRPGT